MMSIKLRIRRLALVVTAIALVSSPQALAEQLKSSNYKVNETYFGIGGNLDLNSDNYKSQQSAGGFAGDGTSGDSRTNSGSLTQNVPFVELIVSGADVNLGVLSTINTEYGAARGGACNCTFSVRSYLSSQYVVKTVSNPPSSVSGHTLIPKTTQGAPNIGTEEFGINLVTNTSPGSFGANLDNKPDNTFADGRVASGYDTPNQFKYIVGDTIASSPKTTGNQGIGQTDYTISYIANINALTPSGIYSMHHDLVVVATF